MNTTTRTERTVRPYAEILQDELLRTEWKRRADKAGQPVDPTTLFHTIGEQDGLLNAYEMVTGVPADNVRRVLHGVTQDFLRRWAEGDATFAEIQRVATF